LDQDESIGFQLEDNALSHGHESEKSKQESLLRHSTTKRQYAQQLLRGLQQQLAQIRKQEKWSPEILASYYKIKEEIKQLKGEFIYLVYDKEEENNGFRESDIQR